jgi:GT2 family glycosyltransferase
VSPRISILLPTWNGERDLQRLLPALRAQEGFADAELIVTDSSSSDGTRALLEAFGADLDVIPASAFGHGRTRNAMARRARGEFLVFLSQDVVPANPRYLAELLEPFADPRVAGVTARVLPAPDDDPLAARTVLDLAEASAEPWVHDLDGLPGVWALSAPERGRVLRFNNVASAVRASVFRALPFPDVSFGEDFAWAARALTAGHRLAYAPRAVAYHAHRYGPRAAFRRYRTDAEFHAQVHGWRMRPTLLATLRGLCYELNADVAWLVRERPRGLLRALVRAPGLRAAQVLGQYVGSRGRGPRVWRGSRGSGIPGAGAA